MEEQRTAPVAWRNVLVLVVLAAALLLIYGLAGTA